MGRESQKDYQKRFKSIRRFSRLTWVRRKRLLKVKNIETLYGLIMAIRGVSLEVQEGQIAAILGGNGAGKTKILKTIMGLLEAQPDKGTIEFLAKSIDGKEAE